jgi:hypothetical protein
MLNLLCSLQVVVAIAYVTVSLSSKYAPEPLPDARDNAWAVLLNISYVMQLVS